MDIIISIYRHWSNMIFDGKKPLEFRTKLPNDISIGDTIYIYETAKHGGARAVVGKCKIKNIINVLRDDGKWPTFGCYPFIDYFCEHIKKDEKSAKIYRDVKAEFLYKFENYKHGYIIDFAFCEEELEHIRKCGKPIDLWQIADYDKVQSILKKNEISHNLIKECDDWLTKIGFYNECLESYYKYAFVLDEIEKFDKPILITDFLDKNNNPISRPPQSWMYTLGEK